MTLGRPRAWAPHTRKEFLDDARSALKRDAGWAAGRLSHSHVCRWAYRVTAER